MGYASIRILPGRQNVGLAQHSKLLQSLYSTAQHSNLEHYSTVKAYRTYHSILASNTTAQSYHSKPGTTPFRTSVNTVYMGANRKQVTV